MSERLILLPGWGLGVAPLAPLAAALNGPRLQVTIEPLPLLASRDPVDWLDELDARLPTGCWLGGWSLGGMLATALAARRGARCPGLLTLASNVRFVAATDWPHAMPAETFAAFREGCATDAPATLKRFALLCAQGAGDARALSRQLLAAAPAVDCDNLLAGLDLLAALDTRAALQAFAGPQLHLFAARDALVPDCVEQALGALGSVAQLGLIQGAGHAFVLECPAAIAAAVQAFMQARP